MCKNCCDLKCNTCIKIFQGTNEEIESNFNTWCKENTESICVKKINHLGHDTLVVLYKKCDKKEE